MRIEVALDADREAVEVDLDRGVVTVRGRSYPLRVVNVTPLRVEVEIDGEKVVVEGWPQGQPQPPGPLDVNGERFRAAAEVTASAGPTVPAPAPEPRLPRGPAPAPVAAAPGPAAGTPVVPPMPGKVVEVRVREGEHVSAGQVLLVLEAMKMRNEVTAPTPGRVDRLLVTAGSSARAREPMLYVVPD